ncbi:MAG: Sir2 family NAD-dependent protein deacetylase [Sphaerobacter sp.]|nr:Sir2 family NAD-dependent protein deacetylase [Sphaerobacter sp.]
MDQDTTTRAVLTAEQRETLEALAGEIRVRRPVVAFTGAGISTESGIPDYRGTNGLWTRTTPPTFRDFLRDPEVRVAHWRRRRERYPAMLRVEPNAGHLALVRLQRAGLLSTIITQNIDGLHQRAGSDPESVIELHGSVHQIRCLDCRRLFPAAEFPLPEGDAVPACPVCGGIVKEATIAFGESLVPDDLRRALEIARGSELMLVIGSSLRVNPAAKVPLVAAQRGAALAIINHEPTPLDPLATFRVRASAGAALTYIADLLIG